MLPRARLTVLVLLILLAGCPREITDPGHSLTIAPSAATLLVDDSTRFTATLRDPEGSPVSATVAWSSDDPAIATVDTAGWVRATAVGSAVVRVSAGGLTASAAVSVAEDSGRTLAVTPPEVNLFVDGTARFTATLRNRRGDTLPATPTWTTSNPAVASVNDAGVARGLADGSATIRATVNGLAAQAQLTVRPRPGSAVLVGAGDIAVCGGGDDEATATLLDDIPGTVFTAGDNAYPDGSAEEYRDCYGPSWGRHKARTHPAPGNHEYQTPGASGYFGYFGAAAGDPARGYYSYTLGGWFILSLNSNLSMAAGSPQAQWVRDQLAANPTICTLAYWHHPRFSSGRHGSSGVPYDVWQALYDAGADLVIVGHDHTYERFAPQTAAGDLDPARGIRQIIVGTGGAGLYEFRTIAPNSEVRGNATKGVLKLTLHPDRYDWEFIPVSGGSFTDSGSASCH